MPKLTAASLVVILSLLLAACASAARPSAPPAVGSGVPPPGSASTGAGGSTIDHPTGATDVVLRIEESGGFLPIELTVGGTPAFSLYGDGRVVFQQRAQTLPEAGPDGITRPLPLRTAQLDAGQIEELLGFAFGQGGLGTARESYLDNTTIDGSNTIFTLNAGGLNKTVTVAMIDMEPAGGPDDAARQSLKKLADRLRDFDAGGTISSDVYTPAGYRVVLVERGEDPAVPAPSAAPWPWPGLTPADFKVGDGITGPTFPHRSFSADEIGDLDLGDVGGGASGLIVEAPDGTTYSVVLRPLLPDES